MRGAQTTRDRQQIRRADMFKNILVPTDGSPLSRKAAQQAARLAKALGARITAFHVAPAYRYNVYADYIPPDFEPPKAYAARVKKIAERHLASIQAIAQKADVRCDASYVMSDFPADAILKAAKKNGCDAIAMATHGRSGLAKLLLGSETTKVLTHGKLPVIVLK
jgi:nucleotide-binding universal stress UspA family protein